MIGFVVRLPTNSRIIFSQMGAKTSIPNDKKVALGLYCYHLDFYIYLK